jgi:uncharacterized protein (TIRG00374 family)
MLRRIVLVTAAGLALYLLIPRLGGLQRNIVALRHAHISYMALAVLVEAASLGAYIALYRHVLHAQGQTVSALAAGQGVMAGFLVSHIVPGGAAAGTVANVRTMEREGVGARTTGVAITLTVILSDIALAVLFLVGVVYSLMKGSLPVGYVVTAVIAIPVLGAIVGTAFLFAFRRDLAGRVVHAIARTLHRVVKRIDADALAQTACDIADEARAVLGGRRFGVALSFALANWLLDVFVLYLFFLAVGHHQHFGALLVAYVVANLIAAVPVTPSGLGVVEATLVAISVGFGATRSVAVVAVLGYRLVNFWLPLPVGLAAYIRARVAARPAD